MRMSVLTPFSSIISPCSHPYATINGERMGRECVGLGVLTPLLTLVLTQIPAFSPFIRPVLNAFSLLTYNILTLPIEGVLAHFSHFSSPIILLPQ